MITRARCIAAVVLASTATAGAADEPRFTPLGTLGSGYAASHPNGISADGRTVVGYSVQRDRFNWHAYRWTEATGMEPIGSQADDVTSEASATSSTGLVVVGAARPPANMEAFRWTAFDGIALLGDLQGGEYASFAQGVSGDGAIVVGSSAVLDLATHAFMWTEQTGMVDLGTLPGGLVSRGTAISADGHVIVGRANSDRGTEAFRWTEQEGMVGLGDLPGGSFFAWANAVSADGAVIVGQGNSETGPEAFRWTADEGMIGLGFLFNSYSLANAVSADGYVVVGEAISGIAEHAPFIWTPHDGMRNLQDVIQLDLGLDLQNFTTLIAATGISADGRTIIGYGYNRDNQPEAWLAYLGPGCRADFNHDGRVDTQDVTVYLNIWVHKGILTDWNYDAAVDIRDFIGFLNAWATGC